MSGRYRAIGALILLFVAVLGGYWQLGRDGEAVFAEDETMYREIVAERRDFRIVVSANGLVRPIDRIELKSKASGEVIDLPIEVGSYVQKGALIAKLDQLQARTQLAQADADLAIAQAELSLAIKNFERRKELFGRDVISMRDQDQTELDLAVARGKLVQARSSLEQAEEQMTDTTILAPVGGLILQKYVERGQIIASGVSNVGGGSPIADIADMRSVHIEAGIDEIDFGKISVGQQATIRAEAFPEHVYTGLVTPGRNRSRPRARRPDHSRQCTDRRWRARSLREPAGSVSTR